GGVFSFSEDGRVLTSVVPAGAIYRWDATTGKELLRHEKLNVGSCAGVSPDGKVLALGGGYHADTVYLREVASGKELAQLRGHQRQLGVVSLAFSPDGKTLATGSRDTTILIWDLSGPAKQAVAAVHPPGKVEQLSPKELESLWTDLADADAAKA